VAWKVTLKEGLVDRDVLEADDTGRALDFDDAIDEKKRVAMRESLKDSFDIHGAIRYPLSAIRQRPDVAAIEA
jgi:hypothetical protein